MPDLSTTNQAMPHPRSIFATCCLLFTAFTSLYLYLRPALDSQPWDSLQYGYSIEVEGIKSIQGNHPLGHLIFLAVFSLARQLGYEGRALTVSQVTNGVLGGLIVATFFGILTCIVKVRALYAIGFSLILGASYSFRFFAGTGDIYHFSMLASLLAFASLVYEITLRGQRFPLVGGILTGLSILSHQLNAVLIPVGLALILLTPHGDEQTRKVKLRQIATFLGISIAMAFMGYLLLGFLATSTLSLERVTGWMRGYFGDPTYGRYLNIASLRTAWLTLSQQVFFSSQHNPGVLGNGILASLGIMMFLGVWMSTFLDRKKRAILLACALECLLTWPLILWWEPQNPKFWLLTLIPSIILLALSCEALELSFRNRLTEIGARLSQAVKVFPIVIGLFFLTVNLPYPAGRQDVTGFDVAIESWLKNSSPGDVIITAGDLIPQLRYWGNRPNTVFLYRSLQASQSHADHFFTLRAAINRALCSQHAVLIAPAASEYVFDNELSLVGVSREELRSYLSETARQGEILFWYRHTWDGKMLPVYALKRPVACSERNSRWD